MQDLILTPVPISVLVNLIASEVEARIQRKEYIEPQQDRIGLKEALKITGLKHSAIYKMTMNGGIPHEKFGKRLIFSRKELESWIKERTVRKQSPEEIATKHLAQVALKKIN